MPSRVPALPKLGYQSVSWLFLLFAVVALAIADIAVSALNPWAEMRRLLAGLVRPDLLSIEALSVVWTVAFAVLGVTLGAGTGFLLALTFARLRAVRHSPLGFGPLLSRPRPAGLTRGWIQPLLDSAAIRHDLTRFARGLQGTELTEAATWLGRFQRPVRLVWGTRDKHFTLELGRRLAAAFPLAQLDEVADATTFVSIDRPDAVVSAVESVLATSRT